ncbi:MAG: hypothetical protein ACTS3F_02695 [Phycisphaerales bacterium]
MIQKDDNNTATNDQAVLQADVSEQPLRQVLAIKDLPASSDGEKIPRFLTARLLIGADASGAISVSYPSRSSRITLSIVFVVTWGFTFMLALLFTIHAILQVQIGNLSIGAWAAIVAAATFFASANTVMCALLHKAWYSRPVIVVWDAPRNSVIHKRDGWVARLSDFNVIVVTSGRVGVVNPETLQINRVRCWQVSLAKSSEPTRRLLLWTFRHRWPRRMNEIELLSRLTGFAVEMPKT